jgi:Flp pilus assembly protein TadG
MITGKFHQMRKLYNLARALRGDTSGLALVEFAYCLPLLVTGIGFGLEMSNLAMINMKVSQSAMALADNMSRVGMESALAKVQIRESDVVDSFIGIQKQTNGIDLTSRGRVILSSLEQNASGGQWIHWQRCIGSKVVSSAYGTQGTGATGTGFAGMGIASARITAPPNSAVMFVEIVYDYRPLFTTMFIPARQIRYEASFIVREDRDLVGPAGGVGLYNPNPASPVYNCTSYTPT